MMKYSLFWSWRMVIIATWDTYVVLNILVPMMIERQSQRAHGFLHENSGLDWSALKWFCCYNNTFWYPIERAGCRINRDISCWLDIFNEGHTERKIYDSKGEKRLECFDAPWKTLSNDACPIDGRIYSRSRVEVQSFEIATLSDRWYNENQAP